VFVGEAKVGEGGPAMPEVLDELSFSSAKSDLSDVMTSVVHSHQPKVVQRRSGKERMLLVRPDDLARWLDTFRLSLLVTFGQEGDVTVTVEEFGVLGFGDSLEEALEDVAEELRAYARRFFDRTQFYMETDRARHYPQLLRFALTPPEQQVELLLRDAETQVAEAQRRALEASE
jgi:hypothetical protein